MTRHAFGTTNWDLLRELRDGDGEARERALAATIEAYWPCVYAWARRNGHDRHQAAELTQGFFADVVIGRGLLADAERERGRLRSLILTALKRYEIDCFRKSAARGLGRHVPDDCLELEDARGLDGTPTAEEAFERRWAMHLFQEALRRAERHFTSNGRASHWLLFERRIIRDSPQPLAESAIEFGFNSPADAAAAIQTVKRRVQALLREVVGESVARPEHAGPEYDEVVRLLG